MHPGAPASRARSEAGVFVSMLAFELDAAAPNDRGASLARLAGVRLCLWGALRRVAGKDPVRPHGALLACDSLDTAAGLADPMVAREILSGTGVAPESLLVESIDARFEVPLEPRRPGQPVFALVASFDYGAGPGDAQAAERHYLDHHVKRSRELPGLRGYVTGTVARRGTTVDARARMGIEIFDSRDALASAFRTPVGQELIQDGQYVCADVRVVHLDGEVVS
jgi:uncharacterized protein (TIGR02118 family)